MARSRTSVRCLALALLVVVATLALPAGASAVDDYADMSVTKTASPDAVEPGQNITYTITVKNNGPFDANDVTLTDQVPASTTFVSLSLPAGWTATTPAPGGTGTVTATRTTLANGASAVFTLVVNVDADTPAASTIENTATVSASNTDLGEEDNAATAITDVSPSADLLLTKSDNADPVSPGDNITYTVALSNNGPMTARGLQVTDPLPAGTTFVSATAPAGWTLVTPAVGGSGTVTATNPKFDNEESVMFTFVVKVGSSVANGTTLTNTASVSSTSDDPSPANNSGTETTLVNEFADLSVIKAASPDPVLAGNDLTYTIEVTNSGPEQADFVVLSDAVPAGTTFVSATQTSGPAFTLTSPATGGTGTFKATRSTLAVGATARFTMVVRVAADRANASTIDNTATVGGNTLDSDASDDTASTSTTVSNPTTQANVPTPTTQSAQRNARLTIGNARMRLPSGVIFVPLTCEYSPADVCIVDVTVTFNTRKYKLAPLTVRNVHVGSGQTVDVYMAASHSQRRTMRRIGTIPVTVTATNPPEADVSKLAILLGLRRSAR
jgi:uncharacterized repeat protein (TIGR01451 family)